MSPTDATSPLADQRYLRMNGLGNEILIVDLRAAGPGAALLPAADLRAVARQPRTRFDQLMAIHAAGRPGIDATIRIYNTDGSPAGNCGNGMRCVAWALMHDAAMGAGERRLLLDTPAGLLQATADGPWRFTVDMGRPRLGWQDIPLAEPFHDTSGIELQLGPIDAPVLHTPGVVSMGNPHAVFFVDDPDAHDLARLGPLLENHPLFPDRANISLAGIRARDHIVLRVWERGAGLTRACGSGACAALVAAVRRGLTDRAARVTLPGGDLHIAWRETDDTVLMTGPVAFEHEGVLPAAWFAPAAPLA